MKKIKMLTFALLYSLMIISQTTQSSLNVESLVNENSETELSIFQPSYDSADVFNTAEEDPEYAIEGF